jgi:hypothetical protein
MKKLLLITALLLVGIKTTDAQIIIGSRGVTVQQRKERVKEPIVKDNEVGDWEHRVGIGIETYDGILGASYTVLHRVQPSLLVGGTISIDFDEKVEAYGVIRADMFTESLSKNSFSPYVSWGLGINRHEYPYYYKLGEPIGLLCVPAIGFDLIFNSGVSPFFEISKPFRVFDEYTYVHIRCGIKF